MGTEQGDTIRIFRTLEHECGYYADRLAQDLVIDPQDPRIGPIFNQTLGMGFRRSGNVIYRPDCANCQACIPVRIDVEAFKPNRTQRKLLHRHAHVTMKICEARRTDEQFDLYHRYLQSRHSHAGMDHHGPDDFDQFLISDWADTRFIEFRDAERLIAVAVTDIVESGISAVYTFFEPTMANHSLGTYAILRQVDWARELDKPFVYMGYWISGHPKMDYKQRFAGTECMVGPVWRPMNEPE